MSRWPLPCTSRAIPRSARPDTARDSDLARSGYFASYDRPGFASPSFHHFGSASPSSGRPGFANSSSDRPGFASSSSGRPGFASRQI